MVIRKRNWRAEPRVVWAIFAKDLRDVLRNKNTISVVISGLFIVGMYRMLPVISRGDDPLRVWVYDQGDSALSAFLENSEAVNARAGIESLDKLQELLREADLPELGIVIPADFDRRLEAGEPVALQGYLMSWVSSSDASEMRETLEAEVVAALGRQVPVQTEGNVLHSLPDSAGPGLPASLGAVFLLTLIGANLVPVLMMAEKQERTLDVLLVSPASAAHVIAAKALTGMAYCLIGGTIALGINANLVMHWWLAILGLVCFSLFAIGLGLIMGIRSETRAQLAVWTWVIFIPLFMPAIGVLLEGLLPDWTIQIMRFTPTVAFSTVLRTSFAQVTSFAVPIGWMAYLLVWAGATLGLAIWIMRGRHSLSGARSAGSPEMAGGGGEGQLEAELLPSGTSRKRAVLGRVSSLPRSGARIVWAIFAKDMREALSNKLLLSILIGTAILVLNGSALPFLLELQWEPSAVVYDQGRSTLVRGLIAESDLRIRLVDSQQEMDEIVSTGPGTWLGLTIPADFDRRAGDPAGIRIEGYRAHWANMAKIRQSETTFEEQLGLALRSTVQIDTEGNELYPGENAGGQLSINLTTLIIAISAIGVALVPLLVVEEKESHTLDALLMSPARYSDVVVGKAMVGLAYCALVLAVALFFNRLYIVHWEVVLLAAVSSAAFSVALGMLVGVLSDNPTSAAMWASPIILMILIPTVLQLFIRPNWPPLLRELLRWAPGPVMINLFRLSVAGEIPRSLLWANLGALAGMAGAIYLFVGWRIGRLYR